MNRTRLFLATSLVPLLASAPALGCGEGIFHMGEGLRYQGYLAPRPATVLVFDDARTPPAERIAVYRGLVQAGHTLTIAHDAAELAQALQQRRYDVVIADLDAIEVVTTATPAAISAPSVLPVVERSQRNAPDVRGRFDSFVLEGASLGQYLKHINRLMAG